MFEKLENKEIYRRSAEPVSIHLIPFKHADSENRTWVDGSPTGKRISFYLFQDLWVVIYKVYESPFYFFGIFFSVKTKLKIDGRIRK